MIVLGEKLASIVHNVPVSWVLSEQRHKVHLGHVVLAQHKESLPLLRVILAQKALQILQALCMDS